jgi:hypothetical protein
MFSNNLNRKGRIKLEIKLIRFFLEEALGHQSPEAAMMLLQVMPPIKIHQIEISRDRTSVQRAGQNGISYFHTIFL